MKKKCGKCDGYCDDCQCVGERIAAALERIAYALELANVASAGGLFPSGGGSGFQCSICKAWVPNGTTHTCRNSAAGSGMYPQSLPPYRIGHDAGGTISSCPTTNCWLSAGHEGNCSIAMIT